MSTGTGKKGKTKGVSPKGTVRTFNGKRYVSEGGGNWRGLMPKPKMRTVKSAPSYNSKKRKVSKRKYGKKILINLGVKSKDSPPLIFSSLR